MKNIAVGGEPNSMKKHLYIVCFGIFSFLCIATICFLGAFTHTDKEISYIQWDTSIQLHSDGTETVYDYSVLPESGDSFIFDTKFRTDDTYGNLIFETSGLDLVVTLNGSCVWTSSASVPDGAVNQAQAVIPLPSETECVLTVQCTVIDAANLLFPPLPRYVPSDVSDTSAYAYANHYSLTAGAFAVIMLMIAALFFIGLLYKRMDWSLIPLFFAAAGIMSYWLVRALGFYFLPQGAVDLMNNQWMGILIFALLILYIVLNRSRGFLRFFALAALGSILLLAVCCLISAISGTYLYSYIEFEIRQLLETGYYESLLYWLTVWLTAVCTAISAYYAMRSFADARMETQSLLIKNQLVMDSYHALESKLRDDASHNHENRHKILTLNALCKNGDYEAVGNLLEEMTIHSDRQIRTTFTENFTINAILQDAAYRSSRANIVFNASAAVPAKIPIGEVDLCELLMNMLDNAIEAASASESHIDSFVRFKIEFKGGFLAVKCENSFSGTPECDSCGNYLSTKENPETHGFGLKLMNNVAKKYNSMLDISVTDENVFTVQTALKLPNR